MLSGNSSQALGPSGLVAAWQDYYAAAEKARAMIEGTERFQKHPEYQARAYASLLEAQAMAYNFAVSPRLAGDRPEVRWHSTWHADLFNLGQPIQDFQYGGIFLDGRRRYRLTGRVGNVRLLLLQVHTHVVGDPRAEEIGNYDFHDLELGPDDSFEVVVGGPERPGNWIRLAAESDCNFVLIRRIMGDWDDDRGLLEIEPIDPPVASDETAALTDAVASAGHLVEYLVRAYTVGLYDIYIARAGGRKNAWAAMPGQAVSTSLIGSPSTTYVPAVWEIAADEAVLIEWDPPTSAYWSFQLGDVWSRPLDFMHRQTDVNMQRAVIGADGTFRAVISVDDLGVPNWLDPTGNLEGTVVARNYRSIGETVEPTLRVIKAADVWSQLPAGTARVDADERARQLEQRRRAVRRFYAH